jgi:hypothetical protein
MAQEGEVYSLEVQLRAARAELESSREESSRLRDGLRRCLAHIRLTHNALRGRILLLPERLSAAQRGKLGAKEQSAAAYRERAAQEFIYAQRDLLAEMAAQFEAPEGEGGGVAEEGGGGGGDGTSLWEAAPTASGAPAAEDEADALVEEGAVGGDVKDAAAVSGRDRESGDGSEWPAREGAVAAALQHSRVGGAAAVAVAAAAPVVVMAAAAAVAGVGEAGGASAAPPAACAGKALRRLLRAVGAAGREAGSRHCPLPGSPPFPHSPHLTARVFSFLTLPELAAASAVCSAWRAVPLRADHALWRTVAASGSVTPQLRGALWSAVLCSAGGGGGASGYEAAPTGGGSSTAPHAAASLHEALALGPTPTALPGPAWPRGLMDALVARLANVAAGRAGAPGGADGGAGGGGGSSGLLLALTPLRPRTVAKLLCPWVGSAWGSVEPAAESGGGGGGGEAPPPVPLPLSFLAGEHGRPGAKGGHALSLSALPRPLVLQLGPEDADEAAEDGSPPPPRGASTPPPSASLFRRYCAAAAANEAAAAAVRAAREAAAALCAARAENRRLERILASAAANSEALPAELSELIARAAEALASAEFSQRRTEAEARAAIRAAHAETDGADRTLVRAVLAARTSLVVRLVQAWAAANVRFHRGGGGRGEPAAATASAMTSPVDGKVVPSHGVGLPPAHRGGEAAGARALCGEGGSDGSSHSGDAAPQLLWLSPSKPAPAALTASICGGGQNEGAPAAVPVSPVAALPAYASIASPASLADAIDSILSAGPPEAALDLSPLMPLPPRLEAAVLAAADQDGAAEEERELGLAGMPFPRAVWGHPVEDSPEAGGGAADDKLGPFLFDLWPSSYAEEVETMPPTQRTCALPALPFLPQGDFIARDVSRTFGELESAARNGEAAGTPPRAADLLPTALLEGGGGTFTVAMVARLRRRLQRVLSANTAYDRGARGAPVIYTQGANYVVAFLLRHMGASASFWAFSSLCHSPAYALRDVYGAGLWRVKCAFAALESLAGERLPKLCARLRAKEVSPTSFATGWVMTLFSSFDALSPSVVAGGVWDPFILRGWKSLLAAMLTVLEAVSPDVSRMTELEQIVTLLHSIPAECLPNSGGAMAVYGRRWSLSYKELAARARQFDAAAHPERYEWARRAARTRRFAARNASDAAALAARAAVAVPAGSVGGASSAYDVVGSSAAGDDGPKEDEADDEEGGAVGNDGGVGETRSFGWGLGRRGQGLLRIMKGGLWGAAAVGAPPQPPPEPVAAAEDASSAPSHGSAFAAALTATLGAAFGIAAPAPAPPTGSRAPSRRQTEGSEVLEGFAPPPSHASSPRGPLAASPRLLPAPAPLNTPAPLDAPAPAPLNTSVPTVNFSEFTVASAPPSPAVEGGGSPPPSLSITVPAATMPTPFFSGLLALPPGSPGASPSPSPEESPSEALRAPSFSPQGPVSEESRHPEAEPPAPLHPSAPLDGGENGDGGGGSHAQPPTKEGEAESPVRVAPGTTAWPSPRDAPPAPAAGGGGGVLAGLRARLAVNLGGLVKEGSFLRPRGPSTDEAP